MEEEIKKPVKQIIKINKKVKQLQLCFDEEGNFSEVQIEYAK